MRGFSSSCIPVMSKKGQYLLFAYTGINSTTLRESLKTGKSITLIKK